MGRQIKRPTAGRTARGSRGEQLAGRLDLDNAELRRGPQAISTPREAVQAMLDAGAVFSVQRRGDALGMSFTYSVRPEGDRERTRAILFAVKAKPPQFFEAFKALLAQGAAK